MVAQPVWCGVYVISRITSDLNGTELLVQQWAVASIFILCVGMSMAELASVLESEDYPWPGDQGESDAGGGETGGPSHG